MQRDKESGHPPVQHLADMAEGLLGALTRSKLEHHVAQCVPCSTDLELLLTAARARGSGDAEAVTKLGSTRITPKNRALVATLCFDSASMPPASGLRSATASSTRQLVFEAGQFHLELQTTPARAGWMLSGQLLGPTDAISGEVRLIGRKVSKRSKLTELLEFNVPGVPTGSYRLELCLGDATRVRIESIEL